MYLARSPFSIRSVVSAWLMAGLLAPGPVSAQSETAERKPVVSPWGISASASSFKDHADWFPKMAAAGVSKVRLFPEWRGFEPTRGTWNWEHGDTLLESAADHSIGINAILMGSPPGAKSVHAFPMENLEEWSRFVTTVVGRYHKQVRHWEVWNEGNGGFNDGRHTTVDYAKLAAVTYAAAKKADPQAQVGLTVASFDAPYLHQTLLALAKAGTPNSFDYLCIHPYEIADGLADVDGEIPFLWMSRTLRDMLKATAPDRANAEIWITEVGHRITSSGRVVTEQDAAKSFAKIYTMALAQGITQVQWFEAQDPAGEDQGFGLLNRDGSARASYKTLKTMTTSLGATPKYLGWVALGSDGRGYGFVFEGKSGPVLIAWMPAGMTEQNAFTHDVQVTDVIDSVPKLFRASRNIQFTDTPVLIVGPPPELVKHATSNAGKNFAWGGDHSKVKTVIVSPASPNASSRGIALVGRADCPTVKFPDGSSGILVQGDINHAVRFYVHPSFASFRTKDYHIRVTVRRVAPGNVGMNLLYEVADSQGRMPYANSGKWGGFSNETGWQTYTWHVTDACFSKMWGHDLLLRPEQSVPFVIGKVEVSTEPFQ